MRIGIALAAALTLAMSACAGAPAPTEPAQSEDGAASGPPEATAHVEDSSAPQAANTGGSGAGVDRPATIHLDISATPDSDGSYTATGPAPLCGDAQINLTGNTRAFNFEFPHSGDFEIIDVTFGADDLVPGSSTSAFHLGVDVHAKAGGEPPGTIVDTSNAGNGGTAQLSDSGGTTTLTVEGSDDIGQTLHLTATCGPRP